MAEGIDLSGKGETGERGGKRSPGRPSNETKHRELRGEIKDSVKELADWFGEERQAEPEELADLIRHQADPIADVLAVWAEKNGVIEKIVRRLVGRGGPLSASRAFGPILRRLIPAVLERRARLYEEEPSEDGVEPDVGAGAYS